MAASEKIHGLLFRHRALDKTYKLNAPSPTERGELDVLQSINGYITKVGTPITITIGKHTFEDVYGANKIEGTPKADIALVSYNKKSKRFESVCYISHKMGTNASGFQQYSGITPKADGKKRGAISQDKTVTEFLRSIVKLHDIIVNTKARFYRVIKDTTLIGKSIYGPQFGEMKYSEDNIHLIGQGTVILTKHGKVHTLRFSAHQNFNKDVNAFRQGDYTTIIGARYSSGRNYEVDGKTYSGVRVLIMPRRLIGGNAKEI
jgi:hypothetical protein